MSLKFKFHKDKENTNEQAQPESGKEIERYDTPAPVRNLSLVDGRGKQYFLNYAYLMTGEYSPEKGAITLTFTTHTVILKGNYLESLFEDLVRHLPRKIVCVMERYASVNEGEDALINEINVVKAAT